MSAEQEVVNAVLYAMRCGLFFPVRTPKSPSTVEQWVKWGAMKNLHNAVAKLPRSKG